MAFRVWWDFIAQFECYGACRGVFLFAFNFFNSNWAELPLTLLMDSSSVSHLHSLSVDRTRILNLAFLRMAKSGEINGAELVARTLRALGITTVFGLTGKMFKVEVKLGDCD